MDPRRRVCAVLAARPFFPYLAFAPPFQIEGSVCRRPLRNNRRGAEIGEEHHGKKRDRLVLPDHLNERVIWRNQRGFAYHGVTDQVNPTLFLSLTQAFDVPVQLNPRFSVRLSKRC